MTELPCLRPRKLSVSKERHCNRIYITTSLPRALDVQQQILAAQYDAETTACFTNPVAWYICNRSGLDPIAYTECFVGEGAAAEMLSFENCQELESRMKKGIVFLCETGCRFRDDGVRLMPRNIEDRMRVDVALPQLTEDTGHQILYLSKDVMGLKDRIKCVHSYVKVAQRGTLRWNVWSRLVRTFSFIN
jgi:hypothetical protein